jgi:uncharacterized protein YndB with AHSA1/START domain
MLDNNALPTVIDGDILVFERTVAHPPEQVWRAISDERELRTEGHQVAGRMASDRYAPRWDAHPTQFSLG